MSWATAAPLSLVISGRLSMMGRGVEVLTEHIATGDWYVPSNRGMIFNRGRRLAQRCRGGGSRRDRHRQPFLGQPVHEVREAATLGAEQVRHRHLDVAEEQLSGVLRVLTELGQVTATLEALHPA